MEAKLESDMIVGIILYSILGGLRFRDSRSVDASLVTITALFLPKDNAKSLTRLLYSNSSRHVYLKF